MRYKQLVGVTLCCLMPHYSTAETSDDTAPDEDFLTFLMEMEDATGDGFHQWLDSDNETTPTEKEEI